MTEGFSSLKMTGKWFPRATGSSAVLFATSTAGILLCLLAGCSGASAPARSAQSRGPGISSAGLNPVPTESTGTVPTVAPAGGGSKCPEGLLGAVQSRAQATLTALGSSVASMSIGSPDDIQPASLRPLMGGACIIKYSSAKTGERFTYGFTTTASPAAIDAVAHASGYTWYLGTEKTPLEGYELQEPGTSDFAVIAVGPNAKDRDFSKFYPTGLNIQTIVPPGFK